VQISTAKSCRSAEQDDGRRGCSAARGLSHIHASPAHCLPILNII
jgi:hypothetical protein